MPESDTDAIPELTDRQKQFLASLPATTQELADELDISPTTVENKRDAIRNKGIELDYDEDYTWYIADDRAPKVRRLSTKHKQTKTREANALISAEESLLLRRLRRTDPLDARPINGDGSEAFVCVLGDLHFGDVVENDRGDHLYDMQTAGEAVREFARKAVAIKQLESEYTDFDDCHLILLGDLATGTHIYSGQVHDIEAFLVEQVTGASQALLDCCETLADAFDRLHIHGVLGNHGLDRASAARGSNTDLLVYRWLQLGLRRRGFEHVSVEIAESTHHLNTTIRDWRVHIRHGQDGYAHVDKTRASESKWRGWRDKHRYDIAFRGHYHEPGLDWVLNRYPVVSAPSPKPGGEFIERRGSPDVSDCKHLGWCLGVGNERPLTFKRLVDDR